MANEPVYMNWTDFATATEADVADLLEQVTKTPATNPRPRVQITITATDGGGARTPRIVSLTADPNRPDGGQGLLARRLPHLLRAELPTEFIGSIRIDMASIPGPLSSSTWRVDVGTRRRHEDPSVRHIIAGAVAMHKNASNQMGAMFSEAASVIHASGHVLQASPLAQAPTLERTASPAEELARYAIDRVAEVFNLAPGTLVDEELQTSPNETAVTTEESSQTRPRFDAWGVVADNAAASEGPATLVPTHALDDLGPWFDDDLDESELIDQDPDPRNPPPGSPWKAS